MKSKVQQIGTPLEVYNKPKTMFVAGFIGSPQMNFFNVHYKDGRISDGKGLNIGIPEGKAKMLDDQGYNDKDIVFGIQGTLNSYTAKNLEEVYNLPALKLASTLDFQITPKWYAGFKIYFTGERKDRLMVRDVTAIGEPVYTNTTVKLNSFFDANAHVGFKYNDRWTFFVKSNNMANQNYQKWTNYPVQGIQVLLGANYTFDF